VDTYATPPVTAVAVVCNVLTIVVLSRDDTMIRTTSLLLRMLAVADLLNVLFTCLLFPLEGNLLLLPLNTEFIMLFMKINYEISMPGQSIACTASAWFQVLITWERYVAVCFPMHVSRLATASRVRASAVIVWLSAALANSPLFAEQFANVPPPPDRPYYDILYSNPYYIIVYKIAFRSAVNTLLPFALLTFFTVRIVSSMQESFQDQLTLNKVNVDKLKKLSSKQKRTTVTLVLIVVIFLVLDSPIIVKFALDAYQFTNFTLSVYLQRLSVTVGTSVRSLAYLLLTVKSMLNFFIFCLTGVRYRKILREACTVQTNCGQNVS
jgi:7 transmembrane receptor (rhodopsin family)